MVEGAPSRCYGPGVLRFGLVSVLVFAAACARISSDRTPSGALKLFLEAMSETQDDPSARARAYALLAPESRDRLAARSRLAAALSNRRFEPSDMLVEGRYRLRFSPRESRGFEERINGDRAIVVVLGARRGERAEVPMVNENGHWRVFIAVPELGTAPDANVTPTREQRPPSGDADAR